MLDEILSTYNIDDVAPIIIFAWSRTFIKELYNHLIENQGINKDEIRVITGETKRNERLKILEELREKGIKIIISSSVGEEGFDLPDAGLLILVDIPSNETRFYQRLGRLLRKNPKHKIKYLAIISTPYTPEYELLPEVLMKLELEGVDISYVLAGLDEMLIKTPSKLIADALNEYCEETGLFYLPYLAFRWGWNKKHPSDSINVFFRKNSAIIEELKYFYEDIRLPTISIAPYEDKDFLLYFYASKKVVDSWDSMKFGIKTQYERYRQYSDKIKALEEKISNILTTGSFHNNLEKAIESGDIFLFPDPELLSDTLLPVYNLVKKEWTPQKKLSPPTLKIETKYFILLTSVLVPHEKISIYKQFIETKTENYKTQLFEEIDYDSDKDNLYYWYRPISVKCNNLWNRKTMNLQDILAPKKSISKNKSKKEKGGCRLSIDDFLVRFRVDYFIYKMYCSKNDLYILYIDILKKSLEASGYQLLLKARKTNNNIF